MAAFQVFTYGRFWVFTEVPQQAYAVCRRGGASSRECLGRSRRLRTAGKRQCRSRRSSHLRTERHREWDALA